MSERLWCAYRGLVIRSVDVDILLHDEELSMLASTASATELRSRQEVLLFVDELGLRYPGGPPGNLVDAARNAVNALPVITADAIRVEITNQETQLGLPTTTPPPVVPANPVQDFLNRLAARRGAYNWAGGTSQAFTNWVGGPAPLVYSLPLTAQINCWEALLVAAAEAGLVTVGTLRAAHAVQNTTLAVHRLLTDRRVVHRIDHRAPAGNNQITTGDIIMISNQPQLPNPVDPGNVARSLHHVVAAVTENQNDYTQVEVMSLWSAVGGGTLVRTKLDNLMKPDVTIQYLTL